MPEKKTFYEGFPDESEWTRPERQEQPSFLQRLTSVGRQEIGDLYRKKPSNKVYKTPNTNVDIPISGLTGFKRRIR